ncbi:MAG: hypothetical protein WBF06_09440 [Candidatus Acidiferrales bacterium]
MNRREFLRNLGASAALAAVSRTSLAAIDAPPASLEIDSRTAEAPVPSNFTGLSYESAQLANPDFFSAGNSQLIELVRSLGSEGVLRLGGGTSEFTEWSDVETQEAAPLDSFGPDTSKTVKSSFTITPLAIRNLRAFLDATGWQLLYGLKAARGTPEEAAAEAEFVQRTIGPRLAAFQIGNEPDAWRNRYFPASWGFQDYSALWKQFHDAIVQRVPQARFAGPDVSNHMDWVVQFAAQAHTDVILLTGHYYAEGPASSPTATMDRLLSPNPKLDKDLTDVMQASRAAGIPYRMTEGNSCWDGGKPGVSDTLGSALWAADMMLQFAQAGCAGVDLHGGGNGYYTPIAGGMRDGFTPRPEYYGMQFAELFSGSTLVKSTLANANDRLTAYAAEKDGALHLALINKGAENAAVSLNETVFHKNSKKQKTWMLTGPSLKSTQNVTLAAVDGSRHASNPIPVPAHSAVLWSLQGAE